MTIDFTIDSFRQRRIASEKVLQDAIRSSINPFRPNAQIRDKSLVWQDDVGKVILRLEPEIPDAVEDERPILTFGTWTAALTGIKAYVEHYPTVFFWFRIYEEEYDEEDHKTGEYRIGKGSLSWL